MSKTQPNNTYKVPEALITSDEYRKRRQIWDNYYKDVRTTRSYKRFQEQREALKKNDMKRVKELAAEARAQHINQEYDLPVPPFPDPDDEIRLGKLGIKEVVEKEIVRAQETGRAVTYANESSEVEETAQDIFGI